MQVRLLLKPKKARWSYLWMAAMLLSGTFLLGSVEATAAPFHNKYFQDIALSGHVTDSSGQPLQSVSVVVTGTRIGTVTDANGNFHLTIPDREASATLSFSSTGFTSQQIPIAGRTQFNIVLKADGGKLLNDIVVVGYGTQRKLSLTGAVNQVTSKDIEDKPVTNVLQALQGESPNLIIQQTNMEPGSGVNLNIRGVSTLGDNTPLVVIDGIIGGDINLLNPNDIASVSILKDAGSAAIYGSRSANGVILITTKSGKLNQKPTVSYNGNYGIQHPYVGLQKVNAWENAYYKNEALVNSGLPPAYTPEQIQQLQQQGNGDWERQSILHNAPQQSHNLTVSGGGPTSSYLISAGYMDQESNLVGNGGSGAPFGYKRYNFRLNQTSIVGRLKLNTILSYVKAQSKTNSNADWVIFADADRVPLNYSFQDSLGRYLTNPVAAQYNVKSVLEQGGYNMTDNDQVFGNVNGELRITRDLKLTGVFGGTLNSNTDNFRRLQVQNYPNGVYGDDRSVFDNSYKSMLLNSQLYAEYNKRISEHSIRVLLGASNESYQSKGFQLQKTLTDPQLGTATTGTIIDPNASFNSVNATSETSINSIFGRLSYAYGNRYFLEGDFREDGSSKFASSKRWGFFPSIAGSWVLTEESFLKPLTQAFDVLKLRSSYGVLGNQNVNAYQYQTSYFNYPNAYGFNNTAVGGAGYILGNPDLTWERAATFNLGLDAALLRNKLNISLDYYNKVTSDILYSRQDVPQLFGSGFPDYNVAKVNNRGWEATVSYTLKTGAATHNFSFNIADNQNKLLALTYGSDQQIYNTDVFALIRKVGQPVTQYYGYQTNGFFQNAHDVATYPKPAGVTVAPGDLKFVDQNMDGVIDDKDRVVLGNPFPRYTFGFTYRLEVKGFDVQVFVQGVGKRDEFLRGEEVEPFHYNYGNTMYENQTDFWTAANPNAKYPRLAAIGSPSNTNNWRMGSDIYRFNAAYARLKNVNIGYTLPASVTARLGIQRLRVSLIGQNLLTVSKLKFIDPETSEFNNNLNLYSSSNSARSYPMPIFYGAGLDITF